MYKLFLSFFILFSACQATLNPEFQAPFCISDQTPEAKQRQQFRLVIDVYQATQRPYTDPNGIWDPKYLQENSEIETALKEFSQKKRGQSLAKICPKGKTVQALHADLVNAGFSWKAVPLLVGQGEEKKFWKLNGDQTSNDQDPEVVKMHIYIHPDGGMVRVKASGVPDKSAKYPRRSPHVVMAVLKKFDPTQCRDGKCPYDTSYENEAFKVTRDGKAGPKAPGCGFKYLFENNRAYAKVLNQLAVDIYMDLVHTDLQTSCPSSLPSVMDKD